MGNSRSRSSAAAAAAAFTPDGFLEVVAEGDFDRFQAALATIPSGTSLDEIRHKGRSALHVACHFGNDKIADFLVSKMTGLDVQDDSGRTAAGIAAARGHAACLAVLLAASCNIELADRQGKTPLMHAAWRQKEETVRMLLDAQADVNARANESGDSALALACQGSPECSVPVVTALCERGADLSSQDTAGFQPLHWAALNGRAEVCSVLLQHGASVSAATTERTGSLTPLFFAVNENVPATEAVVKILLDAGSDPFFRDNKKKTLLIIAAHKGRTRVVELLLASMEGKPARQEHLEAMDTEHQTALMCAADESHVETLAALLAGGCNAETHNVFGRTALHFASTIPAAACLLDRGGADINAQDDFFRTPVDVARRKNKEDLAEYLVSRGGKTNAELTAARASAAAATEVVAPTTTVEAGVPSSSPSSSSSSSSSSSPTTPSSSSFVFRPVTTADHAMVTALEAASYPSDEAATPGKLAYRIANAPHLFRVLERIGQSSDGKKEIVGFVCGTATDKAFVTEESMSTHCAGPDACSVVIHSVVTAAAWRRRGLAKHMMSLFLRQLAENNSGECNTYQRVLLITHEENAGLYASCGFRMVGPSAVHHGSQPWLEMAFSLEEAKKESNGALGSPRLLHINAFSAGSSSPIDGVAGNPACVVLMRATPLGATSDLALFPSLEAMSALAVEMKQPATVFVAPLLDATFAVRFFTPSGAEIPLCGHASLAAAHALWSAGLLPSAFSVQSSATLITASKVQVKVSAKGASSKEAAKNEPGSRGSYCIDLTAAPHSMLASDELKDKVLPVLSEALGVEGPLRPAGALAALLGVEPGPAATSSVFFVGSNCYKDVLVVVSPDVFAGFKPNHAVLMTKAFAGYRIVSVTTKAGGASGGEGSGWPADGPATGFKAASAGGSPWWAKEGIDVVSRCFNSLGEDPVCAAAHAGIAPYWSCSLGGRSSLACFQSSSRGGLLFADLTEDGKVQLTGGADTFLSGAVSEGAHLKV